MTPAFDIVAKDLTRSFGKLKLTPRQMSALLFREHFDRPGEEDLVVIRVTVRGRKDGRRAEVVYTMLDFYDIDGLLSEEERAVRDSVRRFVDERVLPIIGDCYVEGRFPLELVPEMAELDLNPVIVHAPGRGATAVDGRLRLKAT